MFKIRNIEIMGFHSEQKKVRYEFASDNITVLFGDNGCGKTTLLQILNAVFARDQEVLLNHKVNNIIMQLEQNGKIEAIQIKRLEDGKFSKQKEDENKGGRIFRRNWYDWSQLDKLGRQRTLLLGVDRINIVTTVNPSIIYNFLCANNMLDSPDSNYIRKFAEQLSEYISYSRKMQSRRTEGSLLSDNVVLNGTNVDIENIEEVIIGHLERVVDIASSNIQSALFSTLSQVISNEGKQDDASILRHVEKDLKEFLLLISYALDRIPENRGNNEILQLIKSKSEDDIFEECKENKFLCLVMANIMDSIDKEQATFNAIIQLMNCFNKYTRTDKRMVINRYDFKRESPMNIRRYGILIEILNEKGELIEQHKVAGLSSGEKQLLTLLVCLFLDGKNRDFIFIDEPDMSLNIKWQRELVALFRKYNPDTQIIMATHSPSIAENCTECLRKLV